MGRRERSVRCYGHAYPPGAGSSRSILQRACQQSIVSNDRKDCQMLIGPCANELEQVQAGTPPIFRGSRAVEEVQSSAQRRLLDAIVAHGPPAKSYCISIEYNGKLVTPSSVYTLRWRDVPIEGLYCRRCMRDVSPVVAALILEAKDCFATSLREGSSQEWQSSVFNATTRGLHVRARVHAPPTDVCE